MLKSKIWLGVTISLPIIALSGSFLYELALIRNAVPQFVDSDRIEMGLCNGAAKLYEAELVEDEQVANITRLQAAKIANRVVYRHFGILEIPDTFTFRERRIVNRPYKKSGREHIKKTDCSG